MAYGLDFLGDLGSSAMKFAGNNPALTGGLLGAGAGYLMDGKSGALTGGLLGGAAGQGMFGGQEGLTSATSGGLFGQGGQQAANVGQLPSLGIAGGQYSPVAQQSQGLFGGGLEGITDIAKTYGDIQGGLAQRDAAQSEIDYRNRVAAMNEATFDRDFENQAATNQAALDAFQKSKLNSYYSA